MKWLLAIEIVAPIVFVFTLAIWIAYYKLVKKEWVLNDKGTILFELNPQKRKFKIHALESQKISIPNLSINKKIFSGEWINFDHFIKHFSESTKREFRDVIFNLENKENVKKTFEMKLSTNVKLSKKNKITIMAEINKNNVGENIFAKMTWKTTNIKAQKQIEKIKKEDFKKYWFNYSAFFYFELSQLIDDQFEKEFVNMAIKFFKSKNIKYFTSKGVIIIVIFNNSQGNLRSKVKKIRENITKKYNSYGFKSMVSGWSILLSERTSTIKDISSVLIRLKYAELQFDKEKKSGIYFEKEMNNPKFKKYKQNCTLFYQHIRGNMIDSKLSKINSDSSKKQIMNYSKPYIKKIDADVMKLISKNKYNQKILINAHANSAILNSKSRKPILIDINEDWLINNYKNLSSKNIICIVNINSYEHEDELIRVIKELAERQIHIGIRIKDFMSHINSVVLNVKPKILVIDEAISGNLENEKTFLLMISLRKMADAIGSKLIYEKPSKKLDKEQIEKIKLDFNFE